MKKVNIWGKTAAALISFWIVLLPLFQVIGGAKIIIVTKPTEEALQVAGNSPCPEVLLFVWCNITSD